MGRELVGILTPATAFDLLRTDRLLDFVKGQKYQGQPLAERLGGWLKQAQAFRGKEMVCYHKEWAYFSHRFGVPCVELHRGEARHSADAEARAGGDRADEGAEDSRAVRGQLLQPRPDPAGGHADRRRRRSSCRRTRTAHPASNTYFDLMNTWVSGLAAGFKGGAS